MIKRELEEEFQKCLHEYPAVLLTGPRQAGKTTLAKAICGDKQYFSFEDPLLRIQFQEDPRQFLVNCSEGAVFDEAQHVPELFSYLQGIIDETSDCGRFVITGSQQFGLMEKVTQSLAGRIAVLELLPFSTTELKSAGQLSPSIDEALWTGAYPPIYDRQLRPDRWYSNYVTTYVQRDVRQVSQIHNLDQFARFMQLCAANVGQLFNASRIASDCSLSQKTVNNWLSILKAGFIATTVTPYHTNYRKRLVKTPKLYFFDTGLVCHLLGISNISQLASHPLRGAIFENWVFTELSKYIRHRQPLGQLYFWRTVGGQEVDFLLESGGRTLGIEVKSGMSILPKSLRSLQNAMALWPTQQSQKAVIYGGSDRLHFSGCDIIPWNQVLQLFQTISV